MTIKIYHNPRCSKSRQALEILNNKGIKPKIILYLENPPSFAEITEILNLLGAEPRDIMRKKEMEYLQQNLDNQNLSSQDLIKAITKTPKLLERPIVINSKKAAIGRPPEDILKII